MLMRHLSSAGCRKLAVRTGSASASVVLMANCGKHVVYGDETRFRVAACTG